MRNIKNIKACENKFLRRLYRKYGSQYGQMVERDSQFVYDMTCTYRSGLTIIGKDLVAAYQNKYSMDVFWGNSVWYNKEEV